MFVLKLHIPMTRTRIEVQFQEHEISFIDYLAEQESRTRKNLCEVIIRRYLREKKEQNPNATQPILNKKNKA